MDRRSFLGSLLAAATLDPERLLWIPGQKTISIPKPRIALYGTVEIYADSITIGVWDEKGNRYGNNFQTFAAVERGTRIPVLEHTKIEEAISRIEKDSLPNEYFVKRLDVQVEQTLFFDRKMTGREKLEAGDEIRFSRD